LLAKDSIANLEAFGKEAEDAENSSKDALSTTETNTRTSVEEDSGFFLGDDEEEEQSQTTLQSEPTADPSVGAPVAHVTPDVTTTNSLDESSSQQQAPSSAASAEVGEHGQYSGFSAAYHDPYHYHSDYYGVEHNHLTIQSKSTNGFWQSLLPCLFPWTVPPPDDRPETGGGLVAKDSMDMLNKAGTEEQELADPSEKKLMRSSSGDHGDDVSTGTAGSDAFGEKLSTKERQAVLARLGLAQPEAGDEAPSLGGPEGGDDKSQKRGLLKDLQYDPLELPENRKPVRGILKRGTVTAAPKQKPTPEEKKTGNRRSLFPQVSYEFTMHAEESKSNKKHVEFSPMARVVTVKSKNDMTIIEKSQIWWQRPDYDDFRKTGRIITKAMMEGGSELWLSSERATGRKTKEKVNESGDLISVTGDKWWHKFGHSRRGLEHVVSMEEGKQRQLNVRSAIGAVIDEQNRQKLYNRVDPDKLRMVSLQYTSWARDLALASGSSDADAVRSSFSEERKSREFFLLKMSRGSNGTATASAARHVPEFMQPALHAMGGMRRAQPKAATAPHLLDANTAAQIRYRRKSQQTPVKGTGKVATATAKTTLNPDSGVQQPVVDHSTGSDENSTTDGDKQSMAQRAAGFSADGAEKVDMAAVLSGMGAIPHSSQVVSTA